MLNNAKWIGLKFGEDWPFLTEEYSKDAEKAYIGKLPVDLGTLLYRYAFDLDENIKKATLKISGLGYYEPYVNGKMPDENRVLTPIMSDYFKMVRYDTYDVTKLVVTGKNTLCAEVAPGWFTGDPKYWGWQQTWYGNPRLIAVLEIEYLNGKFQYITSNENWKITHGAITKSSVYDGEACDFNLVVDNWKDSDFDDSDWNSAAIVRAPSVNLQESIAEPERIIRTNKPQKVWKLSDTKYGYDFGENCAAMPCVKVKGKKGDVVTLQHTELVNEDGTLNRRTLDGAEATDTFILADDKPTECKLRFTWHGYRYMTIELSNSDIEIIDVSMNVVHNDLKKIGEFSCSKPEFNQMHETYVRSYLSCTQGVTIDCPQRDERKGWLGDAHAVSEMGYYNFDADLFYRSFLQDMNISRFDDHGCVSFICPCYNNGATNVNGERTSIDWNMAYPIIMNEHYSRYGDVSLLKEHYESLKVHTDYYIARCENGLVPNCWFGDWITSDSPNGEVKVIGFAAGPDDHRQNAPFFGTIFYCTTLRLISKFAKILGKNIDCDYYAKLKEVSVKALQDKYYNSQTGTLGSGGQFLFAYSLYESLVPECDRKKVFENLVKSLEEHNFQLVCGVIGTRIMFDVLMEFGREDLIYRILNADGPLSQKNKITGGKTTLFEFPPESGSGCHCMWASPDTSFYRVIGGITIDRYDDIFVTVKPYFTEDLEWAKCSQEITEGKIAVSWKYQNNEFECDLQLPVKAKIILPNKEPEIYEAGNYTVHIER